MGEQEIEIEGQRRDEVNHVDRSTKERQSARADDESYDQFKGEPAVADALDVEESIVGYRSPLLEQPRRRSADRYVAAVAAATDVDAGRQRDVLDRRHSHVGVSFEAERQDRDDDEEDRQRRDDLQHAQTAYYPFCYYTVFQ